MSYCLSIDPGSNLCGISLWEDDKIIDTIALTGGKLKNWSARLSKMSQQLEDFLNEHDIDTVTIVVAERIMFGNPPLQITVGYLINNKHIHANITPKSFILPAVWKAFAKKNGWTDRICKGVVVIEKCFPQYLPFCKKSEDIADSILIYLAWRRKNA